MFLTVHCKKVWCMPLGGGHVFDCPLQESVSLGGREDHGVAAQATRRRSSHSFLSKNLHHCMIGKERQLL